MQKREKCCVLFCYFAYIFEVMPVLRSERKINHLVCVKIRKIGKGIWLRNNLRFSNDKKASLPTSAAGHRYKIARGLIFRCSNGWGLN